MNRNSIGSVIGEILLGGIFIAVGAAIIYGGALYFFDMDNVDGTTIGGILILFGAIFVGGGCIPLIPAIKKLTDGRLNEEGIKIKAKISKIDYLTNVRINGYHPSYIHAVAVNNRSEAVEFKSKSIPGDIRAAFKVGDTITIHVKDPSYKRYTFDYDEIQNRIRYANNPNNTADTIFNNEVNVTYDNNQLPADAGVKQPEVDFSKVFQANQNNSFSAYDRIKQEQQAEAQAQQDSMNNINNNGQ